jgi:hypothetical protein
MARVMLVAFAMLGLTQAVFAQSSCAEQQQRFNGVRADGSAGMSWDQVIDRFGNPTQTRLTEEGAISSLVYDLDGCSAEFYLSSEGRIFRKRFQLTGLPASPGSAATAAPAGSAMTQEQVMQAIGDLGRTIEDLKSQIANLEIALEALRAAADGLAADSTTTTISGTVADARGVRMPGVEVVLSGASAAGTSEVTSTVTDRTGTYDLPGVAPGVYSITASMPGFRPGTRADVTAVEGEPLRFDFSLALDQ